MSNTSDILDFYTGLKRGSNLSKNLISTVRDLTLIDISQEIKLVIACDSDGGIGSKPQDIVQVPERILGRFAVRVPLMEIFASGAIPAVVVDTLAVEMNPSGIAIIEGIREELVLAGLDADQMLTGSTEDNVPTVQTGLGVVVVGFVSEEDFNPGGSKDQDVVVCVGMPKSAPEDQVDLDDPDIADTICVRTLASLGYVHDILPVGSKGVVHEQAELAKSAELELLSETDPGIDIHKSAGPSTCILVSLAMSDLNNLRKSIKQPIYVIGTLSGGNINEK
jgi:hypothetical protein